MYNFSWSHCCSLFKILRLIRTILKRNFVKVIIETDLSFIRYLYLILNIVCQDLKVYNTPTSQAQHEIRQLVFYYRYARHPAALQPEIILSVTTYCKKHASGKSALLLDVQKEKITFCFSGICKTL